MRKALLLALALIWALPLGLTGPAKAGPRASDLVQADLLAEPSAIRPGAPFWVGLHLRIAPHWHTYWLNPGDSGLPTEIKWTLPPGFQAGPIVWPAPERLEVASDLVNYGYETEVLLLTQVTPPEDISPGTRVNLHADANYLVCERECIPGEAKVETTLPVTVANASVPPSADAGLFAATRAKVPAQSPFKTELEAKPDAFILHLAAPGLKPDTIRSAYFFPFDDQAIQHAAAQKLAVDADGITLTIPRAREPGAQPAAAPAALSGVLRLDEDLGGTMSRQAVQIGEPAPRATTSAAVAAGEPAHAAAPGPSGAALLNAALLAFLGGLILNLMPCVFPVLSIKVLGLVRQAGGSRRVLRLHGLAYAAGVVLAFVALAALLLAIRAGGAEIGWGFQLQSPVVVWALAALLFAMGLSLSGLATFGAGLGGVGEGLASRHGLSGSFFTGVLATVVATPCTAPFMATAVGVAATAPNPIALAIFVALGLGMAAPFLALTLAPGLLAQLPRPGAWMETLKQFLAFPLYITVAWLVFVLSQQVGPTGLFAALIGLVCVAFGLWTYGLAGQREGWGRRVAQGSAALALLALIGAGVGLARDPGPPAGEPVKAGAVAGLGAPEPFTQARLDQLRREGRPVFVNLTAAWCITCLVNERVALSSEAVRQTMADHRIVYLKGDWTNQNPEITRLLEQNGRSGVPLYLLYNGPGDPAVLPQILTEATLLDNLARI